MIYQNVNIEQTYTLLFWNKRFYFASSTVMIISYTCWELYTYDTRPQRTLTVTANSCAKMILCCRPVDIQGITASTTAVTGKTYAVLEEIFLKR